MTNSYNLTIETQHPIPHDVLVEHIAVCLNSLNFTGKVNITMNSATSTRPRQHPFDGPEVFDDDVQLEPYTGPRETVLTKKQIQDKAFNDGMDALQAFARVASKSVSDMPEDPYPNVTRAISSLKAARGD